jgi:hypothetical protein
MKLPDPIASSTSNAHLARRRHLRPRCDKDDWASLLMSARKHPLDSVIGWQGERREKAEVARRSAAQARRARPVSSPSAAPAARRTHQRALAARDGRIAIHPRRSSRSQREHTRRPGGTRPASPKSSPSFSTRSMTGPR